MLFCRSLRQQIALHRNEAAPSIERQVDEKTAACNGLKRQLDNLRHEVAQKKDLLDKNRGKLDELTAAANSQNIGGSSQMVLRCFCCSLLFLTCFIVALLLT